MSKQDDRFKLESKYTCVQSPDPKGYEKPLKAVIFGLERSL